MPTLQELLKIDLLALLRQKHAILHTAASSRLLVIYPYYYVNMLKAVWMCIYV
jgi:hypothetical protein